MFRKSLIIASITIILSIPALASAKPVNGGPVISSILDPVGDVWIWTDGNTYGYIDMIQANVRKYYPNPVIMSDILIFEMKLKTQIPRNPEPGTSYLWLIDADRNPITGEQGHNFVGSEYNVRAWFFDGHWQGWVDAFPGMQGGGPCQVDINSFTIRIQVKLNQIGYATCFNWEIYAGTPSAEDYGNTYATCLL